MAAVTEVGEVAAVQLGALLDAGDGAVVTLVAGDTRLAAHRAVLAARSPVFAAMFAHDMLEASSGHVTVPDVEGPVLRELVAYMYTLQVPQLSGLAPEVLAAADKYGLSGLKAVCEQRVSAQLTTENAVAAGVLAVRHSCPSLTAAAVAFIKTRTHQVMATQGWADAVRTHPEEVIELTNLFTDPPQGTRAPPTAEGRPASAAHADQRRTAAAAPPTPPPGDAAVSRMRSLSDEEKGRKLLEAATQGAVEDLRALLVVGTDVGVRNESGMTALHNAVINGSLEAVRCLLECGAEVDARCSVQNTPLHTAAKYGRAAVVRLLISFSADPDARNVDGWTPLHRAAFYGHADVADALLQAGADKAARDDSGATPRHLARQENHQRIIELLT